MKQILLIATGGTIASKYTEHGLAPRISAEEIISYIPSAEEFCHIDTVAPFNLDSTNINSSHWLILADLIEKNMSIMTALSFAMEQIRWHTRRPPYLI